MTERFSKCFRVTISNVEELRPLREMFGETKFREIVAGMGEKVAEKIREQRDPATGEFPVVTSYPMGEGALRIEVDGTEELHRFLAQRLPEIGFNFKEIAPQEDDDMTIGSPTTKPVVFLSHATEDNATSKRIAEALMSKGIDTFYDEWELRSGDSIRRKLEQGLEGCTHFVVLLTSISITKPWVNAEIDAGFIGMVGGKNRFIGLRNGLTPGEVSPFLQTLWLPSISDATFDSDADKLVADIYGISRKPALGAAPSYLGAKVPDLSPAAHAIARHFVEKSEHATDYDPTTNIADLNTELGIPEDDLVDAVDELNGLGCIRSSPHLGARNAWTMGPHRRLFVRFDRYWKEWDPAKDAVLLAQRVQAGEGGNTQEMAEELGWPTRRINPALYYLIDRELVRSSESSSHPYVTHWIQKTDETRRFLKGLS